MQTKFNPPYPIPRNAKPISLQTRHRPYLPRRRPNQPIRDIAYERGSTRSAGLGHIIAVENDAGVVSSQTARDVSCFGGDPVADAGGGGGRPETAVVAEDAVLDHGEDRGGGAFVEGRAVAGGGFGDLDLE